MKLLSESFPVHETVRVKQGITISKNPRLWYAVLLYELYGKHKIGIYLWINRNGQWKRKLKFVVGSRIQWDNIKEAVEQLLDRLEKAKQTV